jgi:hypothetical protein
MNAFVIMILGTIIGLALAVALSHAIDKQESENKRK